MNKVIFTHLEHSADIIISLSCDEESTFGVDGFIIIRTPKYEQILRPDERGATVGWEGSDDIPVLLDDVYINRAELKIMTRGKVRNYHFDLRYISDEEYKALVKHFHLINFDDTIQIEVD